MLLFTLYSVFLQAQAVPTQSCDLTPYFWAYDTPLPDKRELANICPDPRGTLLSNIAESSDSKVVRGSYLLLGHYPDQEVSALLWDTVLNSPQPQLQVPALQALKQHGLRTAEIMRLEALLDSDHAQLQYHTAKIFRDAGLLEPLRSRYASLHPSVQRIVKKSLELE